MPYDLFISYSRRDNERGQVRQCLGEGVAPVFFVTLPDAADPKTDQAIARWIDEIQRRQTFDLRPWHDAGEQALQQAHVRQTLEQLHAPSASNWTVPTCLDSAVPRTTSSNTIRRSSVTCA